MSKFALYGIINRTAGVYLNALYIWKWQQVYF